MKYSGYVDYRKVKESLERVGLYDLEKQSVKLLSGGQRQKVTIPRAIVNSPKFVIAEEPTGALDSKKCIKIMEIFKEFNQSDTTIILVTHDESMENIVIVL